VRAGQALDRLERGEDVLLKIDIVRPGADRGKLDADRRFVERL
jgi:hypothetical protein